MQRSATDFDNLSWECVKTLLLIVAAVVVGALTWGFTTGAQAAPTRVAWRGAEAGPAWTASLPSDPAAATAAYLARVRADIRARGDAFATTSRVTLLANAAALIGTIAMKGIVFDTLIMGLGFLFVGWATTRLIAAFGERWQVTDLRDTGAFPVFWGLLRSWGFLALPVSNSIARHQEAEADMFGINASQQPLGLAEFMIRDAEARQLDSSPVVETWFFNHPSARNRIFAAMRWRAGHLKP